MGLVLARYYRSEADFFQQVHGTLKLVRCPECKIVGALILHGQLYGYNEHEDNRKSCRGRRVFCNNRKICNNGCGHTFSIWLASTLKRLRVSAATLWSFVDLVLTLRNTAQALRDLRSPFSISSAYRLWQRFKERQSALRTILSKCCAAPVLPHSRCDEDLTAAHLKAACAGASCPATEFQIRFQTAFL